MTAPNNWIEADLDLEDIRARVQAMAKKFRDEVARADASDDKSPYDNDNIEAAFVLLEQLTKAAPPEPCTPSTAKGSDFRASNGEVVRRVDLDRAAGTLGRFVCEDPNVAGYEGIHLARAALAGDQSALDRFHYLAGLVLPGVTEHGEENVVRLVKTPTSAAYHGQDRPAFQATNQGGHDCTVIDAGELVAWILSPEGRSALALRGVVLPALATAGTLTSEEAVVAARIAFYYVSGASGGDW